MIDQYGVSQRRACGLVEIWRSTCRLQARPREDRAILTQLRQLAVERPRFGYRRLHVMLRRKGTWSTTSGCIGCIGSRDCR